MLASQVEQQQGDDEKKPLSISEALDVAKGSLEKLKLHVLGEVSEVNVKPGYANAYFTLKDETGTLPCQMWHDRFEKCGITLESGHDGRTRRSIFALPEKRAHALPGVRHFRGGRGHAAPAGRHTPAQA